MRTVMSVLYPCVVSVRISREERQVLHVEECHEVGIDSCMLHVIGIVHWMSIKEVNAILAAATISWTCPC